MAAHESDIAEVERWLADEKTLNGVCPGWGSSYGRDFTRRWGVVDSLGIQSGELCMSCDRSLQNPTICALFKQRLVYRLDVVGADVRETNPFDAHLYGLPATIAGSHEHRWSDNRAWIVGRGFGELPYRHPVPNVRTLEQALAATAETVRLNLTSEQRDVRLPEGVLPLGSRH